MIKNLQKIKELFLNFKILEMQQISRFENVRADTLSYFIIADCPNLPKGVLIEHLKTSSIEEAPMVAQVEHELS